jgi:S1-C subfamily serine protease
MNLARGLFRLPLVLSVVWIASAATAAWADQESLWTYNDSVMYLVSKDQVREFRYQEPRPALIPFGVTPGMLAFRGVISNGEYVGTAYTFSRECGALSFPARGPILDNGKRVLLSGPLPKVDASCQKIGSVDHELEFRLVKGIFAEVPPNGAPGSSEPAPPANVPPSPSPREQPPSSNDSKSGTGFYVSDNGYLITNEHVVNSCSTLKVVDAL